MTIQALKFTAGVRKDDTSLNTEGGIMDTDKVRFSRGEWQVIGGYSKADQNSFTGIARGAHSWVDLSGNPHLAWGTNAALYAYPGGTVTDISPTIYPITAGPVDGSGGSGYGASTYGSGTYGTASNSGFRAQTWTLDNFGEDLLAQYTGGSLYMWQPYTTTPSELITNGDFSSGTGWSTGTGWAIAAGKATATSGTASNLSRAITMTAGKTYRVSITTSGRTAGTIQLKIDATSVGSAISTNTTTTFDFVCPASPVNFVVYKDATFDGSVDDISVKQTLVASRIDQAPTTSQAMFVDPNGFIVLLGTYGSDGVYNPLLVRWSDRQTLRTWVPDTNNLAREVPLQGGSRLVGGIVTRGQNVICSDTSAFSMQFIGDPDNVFSVRPIGTGCGLIGPHAMAEADGVVFWMSNSGQFYMFSGSVPQVIDCPVRKYVFDNLAPGQDDKIYAFINREFGEVWWQYADERDGVECSRYVGYNWRENYWIVGTFARSSWVPKGIFTAPLAFSCDSSTTNYIYYHETGTSADGNSFDGSMTTGQFDIGEGENLMLIRRIIPDFKDLTGALNVYVTVYAYPQDTGTEYGPYLITSTRQKIDLLKTGRQVSFRFDFGDYAMYFRSGHIQADIVPTGSKR